jgi:hypothetical protein
MSIKPPKFDTILSDDAYSKMPNKTLWEIHDKFKDASAREYKEIFVRQKVDGVSCLLILTLSKKNPEDFVFIHEDLRQNFASKKKEYISNSENICQNAWHPYFLPETNPGILSWMVSYVRAPSKPQPYGWFHVHIVTSFGFEQDESTYKICSYQPLYLPDIVLFQLHRNIAGWVGLRNLFDQIEARQQKFKLSANQILTSFLIFRCELALPGSKAHKVTTSIVDSWRWPSQKPKDADSSVAHARQNFQIFILAHVNSQQLKEEFVWQMLRGFKNIASSNLNLFINTKETHTFTIDEFFSTILGGQEHSKLGQLKSSRLCKEQLDIVQETFIIENFIKKAPTQPDDTAKNYCSEPHQWTLAAFPHNANVEDADLLIKCIAFSRGQYNVVRNLRALYLPYRIDNSNILHTPVITTPMIFAHLHNYTFCSHDNDRKRQAMFNNFLDQITATLDYCNFLCQHISFEGFVVSMMAHDENGTSIRQHVKLKERIVTFCLPFIECEPSKAKSSQLGNWLDNHGFMMYLCPSYSGQYPEMHMNIYQCTRQQASAKKTDIRKRIATNHAAQSKSALSVTTEMGCRHAVSRIEVNWADQWDASSPTAFQSNNITNLTDMPLLIIGRNFDKGHVMPAILLSSQHMNSMRQSVLAILKEKERYLYRHGTFAVDQCTAVLKDNGKIANALKIYNPSNPRDLRIETFDDIWNTEFCKGIFENIMTTMFVVLHMRLMFEFNNDPLCKEKWADMWNHASKFLKQLHCTDIYHASGLRKNSKEQYRISSWPIFQMLYVMLSPHKTFENLKNFLNEESSQKLCKTEFAKIIKKLPQPQNKSKQQLQTQFITEIFDKKIENYAAHLRDKTRSTGSDSKKESPAQKVQKIKAPESLPTLNQCMGANIEKMSELYIIFLENLRNKQQHADNPEKEKLFTLSMMTQWWKFRDLFENVQEMKKELPDFEPVYNYFEQHVNTNNNELSRLLQTLQFDYTLFSCLHGLLPCRSNIIDFDANLYVELASKIRNIAQSSAPMPDKPEIEFYWNCLLRVLDDIEKNNMHQLMLLAQTQKSAMTSKMHEFYHERCDRHVPAQDMARVNLWDYIATNMRAQNAAGGVGGIGEIHSVNNLFAQWKF